MTVKNFHQESVYEGVRKLLTKAFCMTEYKNCSSHPALTPTLAFYYHPYIH